MGVIANLLERTLGSAADESTAAGDVARLYEVHSGFVWASLQRMGVRDADLEDVLHEVFVIVHQKVDSFDGSSKVTTWLFGIALRVASAYRRRGFRRHETMVSDPIGGEIDARATPEEAAEQSEMRARLRGLLDELDVDKRVVFVMFEIEETPSEEIAQLLDVPVGTVYSRLHAARKDFQRALARMHARDARGGAR